MQMVEVNGVMTSDEAGSKQLESSTIRSSTSENPRTTCLQMGCLFLKDNLWPILKDHTFGTPSGAASLVLETVQMVGLNGSR